MLAIFKHKFILQSKPFSGTLIVKLSFQTGLVMILRLSGLCKARIINLFKARIIKSDTYIVYD